MEEHVFKVGDRVEHNYRGSGTVTSIREDDTDNADGQCWIEVKHDHQTYGHLALANDCTLVAAAPPRALQIGDRVRVTESFQTQAKAGMEGELVGYVGSNNNYGTVRFPPGFDGHGPDDRNWNIPLDHLVLVASGPSGAAPEPAKSPSETTTTITKETHSMSTKTTLVNSKLTANQRFLLKRSIINETGALYQTDALLQFLLEQNEDAFVAAIKDAEQAERDAKAADPDFTEEG